VLGADDTDILGLALDQRSYRIDRKTSQALLHGGAIEADSPPDSGARFTVRIPVGNDSAHRLH
jgi:hypothetical protein